MIPNFYRTLASMVTSSKTLRCTDLVHSKVTGYTPNSMQSLIPREFATGECNRTSRIHCNSTKKLYRKEQGKKSETIDFKSFQEIKGYTRCTQAKTNGEATGKSHIDPISPDNLES